MDLLATFFPKHVHDLWEEIHGKVAAKCGYIFVRVIALGCTQAPLRVDLTVREETGSCFTSDIKHFYSSD